MLSETLKAINLKKVDPLVNSGKKELPMYWVRRLMSYHRDSIALCNMANAVGMDNERIYDFLYYTIPRRSRFAPRKKMAAKDYDNIILICRKYNLSFDKAVDMYHSTDKKLMDKIKLEMDEGGLE